MGDRRSDRCIGAPSPGMDFQSRLKEWRAAGTFSGNFWAKLMLLSWFLN